MPRSRSSSSHKGSKPSVRDGRLRQSWPDGKEKKSLQAVAKRNGQCGKLGETSGGADFLLAWHSRDFNVPSKRPHGMTGDSSR